VVTAHTLAMKPPMTARNGKQPSMTRVMSQEMVKAMMKPVSRAGGRDSSTQSVGSHASSYAGPAPQVQKHNCAASVAQQGKEQAVPAALTSDKGTTMVDNCRAGTGRH
jgi:hypothetical protein